MNASGGIIKMEVKTVARGGPRPRRESLIRDWSQPPEVLKLSIEEHSPSQRRSADSTAAKFDDQLGAEKYER